jgi:hypothetical protein
MLQMGVEGCGKAMPLIPVRDGWREWWELQRERELYLTKCDKTGVN